MPRLDPIVALTSDQRLQLVGADVRDADGVVRVSSALTLEQLDAARFLENARIFLAAMDEAPVRATKELGNLELRFVARMIDELHFDPETLEWLRYASRRPNEDDVLELHVLRIVLGLAGLTKKRSGLFSVTQRGRRLLQPAHAAALYELLFRTYFGQFNVFYGRGHREEAALQRRFVYALWTIRHIAEHPVTTARIAALMPRDGIVRSPTEGYPATRRPGEFESAVGLVLLEPLRSFGLLTGGEGGHWSRPEREPWQVAPLFDEAISFDFADTEAAPPAGRHLHLVPDANGEGAPELAPSADVAGGKSAGPRDAEPPTVAHLLVTLTGTEPPVWRRLEVPVRSTFAQLHQYLNTAMGWLDYHLHDFEVGKRRIAAPDAEWESEGPHEDEARVVLADVLAGGTRSFTYRYDFGDDWEHLVEVERVGAGAPGAFYPRCSGAARACPPEDCGGVPGYLALLDALADPERPEREDLLEWLDGPYDPEVVDIEGIDRLLHLAATGEIRPQDLDYFSEE